MSLVVCIKFSYLIASIFVISRFIFNKEEESAIFLEVYHLCLEAVLASMGVVLLNNVLL